MGSWSTNPGQGYHASRIGSTAPATPGMDVGSTKAITTPPFHPVSFSPGIVERRDGYADLGLGSPPKHHSPLRQSISYADRSDHPELSPASPTPGSRSRSEFSDNLMSNKEAKCLTEATSQYVRPNGNVRRACALNEAGNSRVLAENEASPRTNRPTPFTQSNTPSPAGSSRFSFLTSRLPSMKSLSSSVTLVPQNDELTHLNIQTALFPCGLPSDGAPFSPAAFMNLQMTASGLLKKFQTAYQHQAVTIQELKADWEAHDDEKAEAETRAWHLKIQLEDMARKASETEAVMQTLMEELNKEKMLRTEERLTRGKATSQSEGSISEYLGFEEDQRMRTWRGSGEMVKSDFSSETDEDSIKEGSLFSRPRSPTLTAPSRAPSITPSISEVSHTENSLPAPLTRPSTLGHTRSVRLPQNQMTTFQKIFKGISGDSTKDDGSRSTNECRNCQGQDANMAWDTVSLLKVENKGLKERVGELEKAVEAALDVVNSIGQ